MVEDRIPYCWIGQEVAVGLRPSYGPMRTAVVVGTLHDVNDLGIVATLERVPPHDDEDDQPGRSFYPWSAVLEIYARPPRPPRGRRLGGVADITEKAERAA